MKLPKLSTPYQTTARDARAGLVPDIVRNRPDVVALWTALCEYAPTSSFADPNVRTTPNDDVLEAFIAGWDAARK